MFQKKSLAMIGLSAIILAVSLLIFTKPAQAMVPTCGRPYDVSNNNSSWLFLLFQTSDNYTAWAEYDGNDNEIILYQINPNARIGNISNRDGNNDVYPQVSGDYVVWRADDVNGQEIYLYDISTNTLIGNISNNSVALNDSAQIDGDYVVWLAYDGNDVEIYLYQISTNTLIGNISNNDGTNDWHPQISGDYVVWYDSDGNDYEIYLYQISTNTLIGNISNNGGIDRNPQIDGDYVVWRGRDGNKSEIFLYQISTNTLIGNISNNDIYSDTDPQINGNYVKWRARNGRVNKGFLYEICSTETPASPSPTPSPSRNTGVAGSKGMVKGVWLNIPAGAVPSSRDADNQACQIVVEEAGTAEEYGFVIDETVWDIKIFCDGAQVHNFDSPITICVKPNDGSNLNKTLFHRHGGQTTFSGLPAASGKSGWVCGTTDQLSLFLAGDYILPSTGFAPETVTTLASQPERAAYANTAMTLTIPKLGISQSIVGVPENPDGWTVSWLGNGVGYLSGTAFPTWAGNTALTGHVWNADGSEGIFYGLDQLQHGDRFMIEAWGLTYTYEVRDSEQVYAHNLSALDHSDYDVVTLITCEGYSAWSESYGYRRVVTAVLVDVE